MGRGRNQNVRYLAFRSRESPFLPLATREYDDRDDGTRDPGNQQRAKESDGLTVGEGFAAGEIGKAVGNRNTDQDDGDHGDPHGGEGIACATHDTTQHLRNADADVTHRKDTDHAVGKVDQFHGIGEDSEEILAEEKQNDGDGHGKAQSHETALLRALFHAIQLACAHVLSGIDGHGLTEGHVGHHGEAIHTHDDDVAGDDQLAHGIGKVHDHHTCHCHDRLRHAGGNAQLQNLRGHGGDKPQSMEVQVKQIAHAAKLDEAENGRDALCQHGRKGYACHAHSADEDQIQSHVQKCGNDQKAECRDGVAETAENAREHIVEEETNNAEEEDIKVLRAPVNDGFGSAQHTKEGHGHQRADDHDEDSCDGREGQTVADAPGKPLAILRAEALRDHHACACGDADKESQQQVQYGHGTAHGGKGVVAHVDADDDRVGGVIELLREISQKHGNGKFHDTLPWSAFRHVLRGKELADSGAETIETGNTNHMDTPFVFFFLTIYHTPFA